MGSNATVLTCTWGLSYDYNVLYIVHTLALSDKEYTNIVSNEVHKLTETELPHIDAPGSATAFDLKKNSFLNLFGT